MEKYSWREDVILGLLIVVAVFAVLANLRGLKYFVGKIQNTPSSSARSVYILVAQQVIISTMSGFVTVVYNLQKGNLIEWMETEVCKTLSFTKGSIEVVFPLNFLAILWEGMRTTRTSSTGVARKLRIFRLFSLIWIVALGFSIPELAMSAHEGGNEINAGSCKEVLLLGSFGLTWVYETTRFIFLHLVFAIYAVASTNKIWSDVEQQSLLKNIPNEQEIIRRILHVYVYTMIFITFNELLGLCMLMQSLESREEIMIFPHANAILLIFDILYQIFLILNPLFYVFVDEQLSIILSIPCSSLCNTNTCQIEIRADTEEDLDALAVHASTETELESMKSTFSHSVNIHKVNTEQDELAKEKDSISLSCGNTGKQKRVTWREELVTIKWIDEDKREPNEGAGN